MSSDLFSIADMADKLEEPTNRVRYMVDKHRLKHVRRVGVTCVFDETAFAAVKEALFNMRIQR